MVGLAQFLQPMTCNVDFQNVSGDGWTLAPDSRAPEENSPRQLTQKELLWSFYCCVKEGVPSASDTKLVHGSPAERLTIRDKTKD